MSESAPESASRTDAEKAYQDERHSAYMEAVRSGVHDKSFEQWDHEQRKIEQAAWQTDVVTNNFGEGGVTGEDVAYHETLRGLQEGVQASDSSATPDQPAQQIEVRTEEKPAEAIDTAEENGPASAEMDTGKENYRREAINPERILELKDEFDQAYNKELELHNIKTDEDKKKDPWLVESSAEHVRNKLLREYLKIGERDWDQEELAEVRNDIIHMMSLSTKTLESLMLKPEGASEGDETTPSVTELAPTPEDETIPPLEELPPGPGRTKTTFNKLKRLSPLAIIVWIQTLGVGRDKEGKPIVAAIPSSEAPPEDPQTKEEKRKKRCWPLALGLGALALGAGYYFGRHGIPFTGGGGGGNKDALSGFDPSVITDSHDRADISGAINGIGGIDLSGIDPNTIHAKTPGQFQQDVLHLLEKQGIHTHGATPERLQQMNEYMSAHDIASGMKDTGHGLAQNVVDFPGDGGRFPNADVSREQGFIIGKSGTGVEGLRDWVHKAEELGITFTKGTS